MGKNLTGLPATQKKLKMCVNNLTTNVVCKTFNNLNTQRRSPEDGFK